MIGFKVNFILAQVEIFVDNVLLTTIPNLAVSKLWTQVVDAGSSKIFINIGQEPFVHTVAGTVNWADPFV